MNKQKIASVIETSPVRLTADETRLLLRAAQSPKPITERYNSTAPALVDIGLFVKVAVETEAARRKRTADAWAKAKLGVTAKDAGTVNNAMRELAAVDRNDGPEMGYVLTAVGKEVARGISVRITKR
jgi:hypothetical protein